MSRCEHIEVAFVNYGAFSAFGCESQAYICLTALHLVAQCNHIACGKGILSFEEVQILIGRSTIDAQAGTTHIGFIPREFCVQSIGHHIAAFTTEYLIGKPPAPSGQVVLHTNVVPFAIVLLLTHPVEVFTITQVEISDERFFSQIPRQCGTCRHHARHTGEVEVVGIVLERILHRGVIGRVARTAGEPAFGTQHIRALLDVGS